MQYPKVKHKIPELFELIIATDDYLSLMKALSVVSYEEFKTQKRRRWELSIAAEKFIQEQRKP